MSQVQQVSTAGRILDVLKTTLSVAKNHKKKTILLVIILSLYSLWKLKHKIPYQKIIAKIMSRIMQAMDKQMKHQQFMEQCNINLTLSLKEFEKTLYFTQLQAKYGKLFKLEGYRNELRAKVKLLNSEAKTELWQNIIDEAIVFVFFFLIITRQTATMNMIQKTLVAKYKDDFIKIIGINQSNAESFHLLDQILNNYCQTHIDYSISDTLKFLQANLKHQIKPTTDMNFFELQKVIMKIFQDTVFNKIVQKQDYKSASSHLTNSIDRPVEKIFFEPHDPTFEKPSIITRSVGLVKGLGKFILPNMFPEEQELNPTRNRYEILNILFNSTQQESVAEMNSNKIISTIFKQYIVNNIDQSDKRFDQEDEEDNHQEYQEEQKQNTNKQNSQTNQTDKVIDLRSLQSSNTQIEKLGKRDDISNLKIEQAKAFCSLVIKELRDILEMSSLHNYFYFSCQFEMRKFMNRLLLLLQKKNELNKTQSFALFSKYFDKLIVEEFLKQDSDINNEGFYQVRLKKCFVLAKNVKSNNNSNSDEASHSTDAMSNPNKSEQDLISSGENQLIHASSDNILPNQNADPLEYLINLNILQEIEQNHIVEESLQELIKRIFFEREKTTVQIETKATNTETQADNAGGDIGGLMSLLGGGGLGNMAGGADIMSLLNKI